LNAVTNADQWENDWYLLCNQFHPEVETVATIAPVTQGEAFLEGARKIAPTLGITIVHEVLYEAGTTDFYPVLTPIVAKNPDAIEGCAGPPGEFALIVKQARELGYEGWFWFGNGTPQATFLEVAGPENSWHIASNIEDYTSPIYSERVQELNQEWLEEYADPPGRTDLPLVTTSAYNTIMLYKAAIEHAGSIDPEEVMKALDDPELTFDTFAAEDVHLGGIESYGIRRQIPHATAYGEIVDADNIHLSMGEVLSEMP
jgi:ABC-type branched-subunit amino acid transport system substrate-binding protein